MPVLLAEESYCICLTSLNWETLITNISSNKNVPSAIYLLELAIGVPIGPLYPVLGIISLWCMYYMHATV
ncbi:hypothetical protein BHE74_00013113 [Ensete ventricosum]|uniref:Uncharacterized protein n=1 Tax=Ensete ventricosum TaxID=4639 RepID=A0A445MFB2_ENSVE|nr:hypothetical protein BHE74_00013113 [Ensete ventricosum]RZR72950.1 hypothetical protein BHM03_00018783 [Ensete ventricosum]